MDSDGTAVKEEIKLSDNGAVDTTVGTTTVGQYNQDEKSAQLVFDFESDVGELLKKFELGQHILDRGIIDNPLQMFNRLGQIMVSLETTILTMIILSWEYILTGINVLLLYLDFYG